MARPLEAEPEADADADLDSSRPGSTSRLCGEDPAGASRTDAELMDGMKRGDRDAFREIVERHRHNLIGHLTALIRDRDRGEEIAQEAFIRLWEYRTRYEEQGMFVAYLYRIATNLLRDQERKARRREALLRKFFRRERSENASTEQGMESHGRGCPQEELLRDEATERVARALAALPLRYRSPLVLREVEGWSYQDIAKAIGCREGTVKSRIHRGRSELRRLLAAYWNGSGATRNGGRP
jgi:RNA polymerase sigma-70 factor (ECF subfamily)